MFCLLIAIKRHQILWSKSSPLLCFCIFFIFLRKSTKSTAPFLRKGSGFCLFLCLARYYCTSQICEKKYHFLHKVSNVVNGQKIENVCHTSKFDRYIQIVQCKDEMSQREFEGFVRKFPVWIN